MRSDAAIRELRVEELTDEEAGHVLDRLAGTLVDPPAWVALDGFRRVFVRSEAGQYERMPRGAN